MPECAEVARRLEGERDLERERERRLREDSSIPSFQKPMLPVALVEACRGISVCWFVEGLLQSRSSWEVEYQRLEYAR